MTEDGYDPQARDTGDTGVTPPVSLCNALKPPRCHEFHEFHEFHATT